MFEFGKNWNSFSTLISEERISLAQAGLRRLYPNDEIAGKRERSQGHRYRPGFSQHRQQGT